LEKGKGRMAGHFPHQCERGESRAVVRAGRAIFLTPAYGAAGQVHQGPRRHLNVVFLRDLRARYARN
jgi:hypothetical protein